MNENNQGWRKNFKSGFDLCTGDLIFPSDQDDVWHLDKIEKMVNCIYNHAEIQVLASNYNIFYTGSDKGQNAYRKPMINDGRLEMVVFNPKWCYIARPGCTYCFRKEFYLSIINDWNTKYAHDAILWRHACIQDGLAILHESLIDFRRHGDNATSIVRWSSQSRIDTIDDYIYFHELALSTVNHDKKIQELRKGITFLQNRKELLENHKISSWFLLILKYRQYYYTKTGWFADLYYAFK